VPCRCLRLAASQFGYVTALPDCRLCNKGDATADARLANNQTMSERAAVVVTELLEYSRSGVA
jgi:hypothetical protein